MKVVYVVLGLLTVILALFLFGCATAPGPAPLLAAPAPAAIIGVVDGLAMVGTDLTVSGWTCTRGSAAPISATLYANGTEFISVPANLPSEPAVAAACGTAGANYRWRVVLSPAIMTAYGYQVLTAFGIDCVNRGELVRSGTYRIPNRVVTAVGDGVHDDTAAIQAAVSLGGSTFLPVAAYRISQPVRIGSNAEVRLDGRLFWQRVTPPYDARVYKEYWGLLQVQDGAHNVEIDGTGSIDGNFDILNPAGSLQIPSLDCCQGGIIVGGPIMGSYDRGISNVVVRGLTVRHILNGAVFAEGSSGVVFRDLIIDNAGNSVGFAHGTRDSHAYNLTISNVDDIGFAFYNGVTGSSIEGSTIIGAANPAQKHSGFGLYNDNFVPYDAGHPGVSDGISLINNTAVGNVIGFDLFNNRDGGASTDVIYTNITMSGNVAHNNAMMGVAIAWCSYCALTNHTDYQNGGPPWYYGAGVQIGSPANHVTVTNSRFSDETPYLKNGLRTGRGVSIVTNVASDPNLNTVVIDGNTFTDAAPVTMDSALCLGGSGSLAMPPVWTNNAVIGFTPVPGCQH